MRKTLVLTMVLFCVMVQGCGVAFQRNAEQLAQTAKDEDYGPMPTDYQNTIKSFMEISLFDPESARYSNWEAPRRYIIQRSFASPTPVLGWQVGVYINAKNRMGGYVGAIQYSFFFINNRIYAYQEARREGAISYWTYLQ